MNRKPFLWLAAMALPWIACGDTPAPQTLDDTVVVPDASLDASSDRAPTLDTPVPDTPPGDGSGAPDTPSVDDAKEATDGDSSGSVDANDGFAGSNDGDGSETTDVDAPGPDAVPDVPTGPPCETALELAAPTDIATVEYANLTASGGTGQYRFTLVSDGSGAIVNELSGAYVSGSAGGTVDRIRLTDLGCGDVVVADIAVHADPQLVPGNPTIPVGACIHFEVQGGSGDFTFELVSAAPIGSIDDEGVYLASDTGVDLIRVTDVATGRTTDASINVDADASLETTTSVLAIPMGGYASVPVAGGSGFYTLTSDSVNAEWESPDRILGAQVGQAQFTVLDSYIGCIGPAGDAPLTTTLPVVVMEALTAPTRLWTDAGSASGTSPGDLDGDGDEEAIIGMTDYSGGGKFSGAVAVVSRTVGTDVEVVQLIEGPVRDSEFGFSVDTGDIDGDGHLDLAVGARTDRGVIGGSTRGRLYLFKGLAGGFFEPEPFAVMTGHENGELLGSGVALCDFNGDGWLDVAGGAHDAEDETLSPVPNNSGAVHVWHGGPDGFSETPDTSVYGVAPDESGDLAPYADGRLGGWVSAGDMDGDGACELAANMFRWDTESNANDGAILLYKGGPDGISQDPVRFFGGADNLDSNFGHRHAMGDINGDGLADLVVSQHRYDTEGTNERGAVRVLFGTQMIVDTPANSVELPSAFDWIGLGSAAGNELGFRVRLVDMNLDGLLDIVAMSQYGEAPTRPTNAGGLSVFFGVPGGVPSALADRRYGGDTNGDRFGRGYGSLGDVNGDGEADLAVWQSHDSTFGINAGRLSISWGWPKEAISMTDSWRYLVAGPEPEDAPPAAWKSLGFDDSSWDEGTTEIGYGQDDEATVLDVSEPYPPSIYLRKTFDLDQLPAYGLLRLRFNNGVAVYLNGQLIAAFNVNIPVFHQKFANTGSGATFNETVELVSSELWPFVEGDNVLAIVLKTGGTTDANASFAAALQTFDDTLVEDSPNPTLPLVSPVGASLTGIDLLELGDMTGDGVSELAVAAREDATYGKRAGSVAIFAGTTDGVEDTPHIHHGGFWKHGSNIQYGGALSLGDIDDDGELDFIATGRNASRPGPAGFPEDATVDVACDAALSGSGAVYVFESEAFAADTNAPDPRLVIYGLQKSKTIGRVVSGFDLNGDDHDDIAFASHVLDNDGTTNVGGVGIVYGKPFPAQGLEVICEPDQLFFGRAKDDNLGLGLTAVGDIDGDGCDEIAMGAYREDLGNNEQGTVRVLFGYGPGCSSNSPRALLLGPQKNNSQAGYKLIGGRDLDGDNLPDLIVGGPDYRADGKQLGAVWMVPGSYLLALQGDTVDLSSGAPFPEDATVFPLVSEGTAPESHRLIGKDHQGRFGQGLFWVPGTGPSGLSVGVGAEQSDRSGAWRSGLVEVYTWDDGGWVSKPLVTAVGESYWDESRLGRQGAAIQRGQQTVLYLGAYRGTPQSTIAEQRDDGAVYVLPMPTLP